MLEAQVRIQAAQKQLTQEEPDNQATSCQPWTESTLKEQYQTLKKVRDELGVAAKSWKDAVKAANQQQA